MLVVLKMLIFQRAPGDPTVFRDAIIFKDANILQIFEICLHHRVYRDANSFKDTTFFQGCKHFKEL